MPTTSVLIVDDEPKLLKNALRRMCTSDATITSACTDTAGIARGRLTDDGGPVLKA